MHPYAHDPKVQLEYLHSLLDHLRLTSCCWLLSACIFVWITLIKNPHQSISTFIITKNTPFKNWGFLFLSSLLNDNNSQKRIVNGQYRQFYYLQWKGLNCIKKNVNHVNDFSIHPEKILDNPKIMCMFASRRLFSLEFQKLPIGSRRDRHRKIQNNMEKHVSENSWPKTILHNSNL